MSEIASRDLRNHTAEVLRQVAAGDRITITVRGVAVAEIRPVRTSRRSSLPKAEFAALLAQFPADAELRTDLHRLAGETTDDLGPIL